MKGGDYLIKINDDMDIEKYRNDKGYFKLFVKHYCIPSICDNCTFKIFDLKGEEVLKINSFDFDKEGYFFKFDKDIKEGNYIYCIDLQTENHFLRIIENRGFIVK